MGQEKTEILQIKVQESPPNCPVPPPCPVVPKPKLGRVVLKIFLVFILALVLALVILAASGLRIVRKESPLDIWLSSRKPTPIPTLVSEPTPSPSESITVTPTSSPSAQTKGGLTQGTPVKIKSISLTTSTGPLVIKGTADPGWMFEGSMPVLLLDSSRNEIATASATETTPGSWQTGNPVNFSVSFSFTTEDTSGFLVFQNDNPSGLPENTKSFEIPVKFK